MNEKAFDEAYDKSRTINYTAVAQFYLTALADIAEKLSAKLPCGEAADMVDHIRSAKLDAEVLRQMAEEQL